MLWIEMLWIEKLRIEKASETDIPLQPRQYLVFDEMPDLLHIYIPVVFINIVDIFPWNDLPLLTRGFLSTKRTG